MRAGHGGGDRGPLQLDLCVIERPQGWFKWHQLFVEDDTFASDVHVFQQIAVTVAERTTGALQTRSIALSAFGGMSALLTSCG
jgi:hypothetical protein